MIQTQFHLDTGTAQAIHELRAVFGTTDSLVVIKKAIALARIAARNSTDDSIEMINPEGTRLKILLSESN